jgi:hypothetical protein
MKSQNRTIDLIIDLNDPRHHPEEVFKSFLDWRLDLRGGDENSFSISSVVFWFQARCYGTSWEVGDTLVRSWVSFGWVKEWDNCYSITREGMLKNDY